MKILSLSLPLAAPVCLPLSLSMYTYTCICAVVQSLSHAGLSLMDCSTARLLCPSLSPRVCSHSCALSWSCCLTISSSAGCFFCFQAFPASRSFPVSQLFKSGGQSIGVSASASVLPVSIQSWFLLGWTGWISFESGGQSIGVSASASVLPVSIQSWFPLGWTGWILQSKDSQESFRTPQFKSINSLVLSLLYGPTLTSMHDYWKNHSFDYMDLYQQSNVSVF